MHIARLLIHIRIPFLVAAAHALQMMVDISGHPGSCSGTRRGFSISKTALSGHRGGGGGLPVGTAGSRAALQMDAPDLTGLPSSTWLQGHVTGPGSPSDTGLWATPASKTRWGSRPPTKGSPWWGAASCRARRRSSARPSASPRRSRLPRQAGKGREFAFSRAARSLPQNEALCLQAGPRPVPGARLLGRISLISAFGVCCSISWQESLPAHPGSINMLCDFENTPFPGSFVVIGAIVGLAVANPSRA